VFFYVNPYETLHCLSSSVLHFFVFRRTGHIHRINPMQRYIASINALRARVGTSVDDRLTSSPGSTDLDRRARSSEIMLGSASAYPDRFDRGSSQCHSHRRGSLTRTGSIGERLSQHQRLRAFAHKLASLMSPILSRRATNSVRGPSSHPACQCRCRDASQPHIERTCYIASIPTNVAKASEALVPEVVGLDGRVVSARIRHGLSGFAPLGSVNTEPCSLGDRAREFVPGDLRCFA
jgi:hypothetical protein